MSAPWCNECRVQAVPMLGNDGKQQMMDPKGARFHKRKEPAFYCPECLAAPLFEPYHPPADPDRTAPRIND